MTVTNAENNSTAPVPSGHPDTIVSFPGPRAKAVVSVARNIWHAPRTNQLPKIEEEWAATVQPEALRCQKIGLILPADERALSRAAEANPNAIIVDLNAECESRQKRVMQALQTAAQHALTSPQVWLLPRSADFSGIDSSLHDVAVFVATVAEGLGQRSDLAGAAHIGIELNAVRSLEDALRWEATLCELERALELSSNQIRVILRIDTFGAMRDPAAVMFPLRERLLAIRLTAAAVMSDMVVSMAPTEGHYLPARQDALTLDFALSDAMSKHFTVVAHRHGVLALSGLLPALPVHDDEDAQAVILGETRKLASERVRNGYDGLALAHTALIPALEAVFAEMMPTDNQLERPLDWSISAEDLELKTAGPISDAGFHNNVGVAILGIEAALKGQRRIALYNQIEDKLSIALCWQQLWQWLHTPGATIEDGRPIDESLFNRVLDEELEIIRLERNSQQSEEGCIEQAAAILKQLCLGETISVAPEFHLSQGNDRT